MSSHFEHSIPRRKIAHVVIGPEGDPAVGALSGPEADIVRLLGTHSDGRTLLALIAKYDQIIYWPFTTEVGG